MLLQSTMIDTMQDALHKMLSGTVSTIPKVLMAFVILIVGLIVAKVLQKLVVKLLKAANVDKMTKSLEKIDIVHKSNINVNISAIIGKFVYYLVMLMVLILSSSALGMPEVTNLMSDILKFLPNLLVAVIVLILGTLLADAIKNMVLTALKSLGVPSANMISTILFYFLFVNVVMIALKQAKVETDFLAQNISIIIAGLVGAFAIGYGLASKDKMANILASLSSKQLFKIGDHVTVDGVRGVVSGIDQTRLTIDTEDGKVLLPLSKATNQKITFHNHH